MIRVVTYDEYDPVFMNKFCGQLYTAFGVGSEFVGQFEAPSGVGSPFKAKELLEKAPKIRAFEDDRLLFMVKSELAERKLSTGTTVPTLGFSEYKGQKALISTSHLTDLDEQIDLCTRFAMQEIGHTLGMFHCLDTRCAMHPHWVPSYLLGTAKFCDFCRELCDAKIRLAKS